MTNELQAFQRSFGRHLRDPHRFPRPQGIPARAAALYGELLFNNVCGFLDACFPVCRELLGETRWRRVNRDFYRDWPLHTPWFREIPHEFVHYLHDAADNLRLPPWFSELAHYEWVELAVDTDDTPTPEHDPQGDLMDRRVVVNPTCKVLTYAWPVHLIGSPYRPRQPKATYLVVHRGADDNIQFTELNALTARLLELLSGSHRNGQSVLQRIAKEQQHPCPSQLIAWGRVFLADLRAQGIVLGSGS